MHNAQSPTTELTIAVFGNGRDISTIQIDGYGNTSERVPTGYRYCGCIGVVNGVPSVQCEPGAFAAIAMIRAGVVFAGMLGERIKQELEPWNNTLAPRGWNN